MKSADDSRETMMPQGDRQKKENFSVVRGGRYAQRPGRTFTPEEIRLDDDMARLFAEVRGANGQHPTRGFQRTAYGEAFPWRVLARYVVSAADANADEAQVLAISERFTRFVRETFRKRSPGSRVA